MNPSSPGIEPGSGLEKIWLWLFLCAPALFFLWGLFTFRWFPPLNYNIGDEVWALVKSQGTLLEPPTSAISPRLFFAINDLWTGIFPVEVWSVRLLSLLYATGLILLAGVLARRVAGPRAAAFTAWVLATGYAFGWQSRVARPEMLSALIAFSAFFLLLEGIRTRSAPRLFFSALLGTLLVNAHANNLQFAFALAIFWPLLGRKALIKTPWRQAAFPLGLLAGVALWFLWRAAGIEAPASPADIRNAASAGGGAARLLALPKMPVLEGNPFTVMFESLLSLPRDYLLEYPRMFDRFFARTLPQWATMALTGLLVALGLAGRQRRLVAASVGFVILTAYVNYLITARFGYWHVVEYAPFFALAAGVSLSAAADFLHKKGRPRLGAGLPALAILAFVILGPLDLAITQARFAPYSYEAFARPVVEALPEGEKAIATDLYWPALKDRRAPHWLNIDIPGKSCPDPARAFNKSEASYVIVDDLFRVLARRSCGASYERELLRFLTLNGKPLGLFETPYPSYWVPGGFIRETYLIKLP